MPTLAPSKSPGTGDEMSLIEPTVMLFALTPGAAGAVLAPTLFDAAPEDPTPATTDPSPSANPRPHMTTLLA